MLPDRGLSIGNLKWLEPRDTPLLGDQRDQKNSLLDVGGGSLYTLYRLLIIDKGYALCVINDIYRTSARPRLDGGPN